MALQANSFAALFDRPTFEDVKKRTVEEVNRIAQEFDEDALTIGCDQELEQLRSATHDALVKLPFPEELSMGRAAIKEKAIGAGLSALGILISGGDPISEVQKVAEDEAERRLSSLGRRYSEWWDQYSPLLQNATTRMQDKLFNAVLKVSSALQKS